MKGWFRKSGKVTADTARRITGISVPFGGLQWADPGPSEAELVQRFLVFLEDRRALYVAFQLEVESQVDRSIHEIREECTKLLQSLQLGAFAVVPLRTIREAGRRFHDDRNEEFLHFEQRWHHGDAGLGFFVALGGFRATVGHQVAVLAAHYDIDVEGDLSSILPRIEKE